MLNNSMRIKRLALLPGLSIIYRVHCTNLVCLQRKICIAKGIVSVFLFRSECLPGRTILKNNNVPGCIYIYIYDVNLQIIYKVYLSVKCKPYLYRFKNLNIASSLEKENLIFCTKWNNTVCV